MPPARDPRRPLWYGRTVLREWADRPMG
jgi:hypothetical protein